MLVAGPSATSLTTESSSDTVEGLSATLTVATTTTPMFSSTNTKIISGGMSGHAHGGTRNIVMPGMTVTAIVVHPELLVVIVVTR